MSGGDQDWQVGDLALCVSNDGFDQAYVEGRPIPAVGSVNRVTECIYTDATFRRHPSTPNIRLGAPAGVWLALQGFEPQLLHCSNFRKIKPHTPDAEDAETIRLLNSAPARTAEPVS